MAILKGGRPALIQCKCPFCGKLYAETRLKSDLVPRHRDWKTGKQCPGSEQYPRSVHDRRPLWKDDPTVQE